MADWLERVQEAAARVEPDWSPERDRRARAHVEQKLVERRRGRTAMAFAVCCLALLGAFAWRRAATVARVDHAPAAAPEARAPELMRLGDGSVATAKEPGTRLETLAIQSDAVAVRLAAGAARFSVTPNPNRQFQVLAGDVTVSVLGTVFSVSIEQAGVRVSVERGRVRVASSAGEQVLGVGDEAFVRNVHSEPSVALEAPSATATPEPREAPVPPAAPAPRAPSWRDHALDGDYLGAYSRMVAEGPSTVHDDPGDLLLSADVARLGGHPEKAIAPLERVVTAHSGDSRAPLAAFTLGRTLLDQLGKPREAAAAFATARRLEPGGALAQDALAREVESWSRAGEATLARERGEEYFRLYPHGRRANAVRRLAGLD